MSDPRTTGAESRPSIDISWGQAALWNVSIAPSRSFPTRAKGVSAQENQSPLKEQARLGYWSLLSAFGEQAPVPQRG